MASGHGNSEWEVMMMGHDVYVTEPGFSCRRCSLWARFRSIFDWWSCPPPDGR